MPPSTSGLFQIDVLHFEQAPQCILFPLPPSVEKIETGPSISSSSSGIAKALSVEPNLFWQTLQ